MRQKRPRDYGRLSNRYNYHLLQLLSFGFLRPRQRIYCSIELWLREKLEHEFLFPQCKTREKIQLMKTNPRVGFELDTGYRLQEGKTACEYSAGFQSIIGNGIVSMIHNNAEKKHALQCLMYQNTHKKSLGI